MSSTDATTADTKEKPLVGGTPFSASQPALGLVTVQRLAIDSISKLMAYGSQTFSFSKLDQYRAS